MKLTPKQRLIVAFVREHGSITVEQCQSIRGVNTYYCNQAFHCGNLLRLMAKRGYLVRVKKGLYELPKFGKIRTDVKGVVVAENQQQLF